MRVRPILILPGLTGLILFRGVATPQHPIDFTGFHAETALSSRRGLAAFGVADIRVEGIGHRRDVVEEGLTAMLP